MSGMKELLFLSYPRDNILSERKRPLKLFLLNQQTLFKDKEKSVAFLLST